MGRGPSLGADDTPLLELPPGSDIALAQALHGTQSELAVWTAPVSKLEQPDVSWTPFVSREDGVTAVGVLGEAVYLLTHKDAPTFKVLSLKVGTPLGSAKVVVPPRKDLVLDALHVASDALYVVARRGPYSVLLRAQHGSGKVEEVALPFKGVIKEAFADPRRSGIEVNLQSFAIPPTTFAYTPGDRRFVDLKLGVTPRFDSGRYAISDLKARAKDGVAVPLTLVRQKAAKGPQVLLVQAYGSYGISQQANFSLRTASFMESGGSFAMCHVRGGGELGEEWRLAGKDARKPNSWRDLIACAETLIAGGYTTREKLFAFSGSAGGIVIGRAFTDRPDLFAGVIAVFPEANTLRQEFQPNGPINIPEFGTITTEQGFRNLYEMDTIQHVRPGTRYPHLLITTALNDPRVAAWEPAKLAAALQASGSHHPVLLRVDADAGHGFGSTKAQEDALYADMWAFVFSRAGVAGRRPADPR